MQLTPNYNLKKPEETDPIDILDLNDNADIIDAEFKKRPVASGGDVSEMTVKTLETTTTEFPVPVAGESTKTFLGKVKKFFEDTKNWMTGVCLIGQIVNNCVTNNAKLPLSAAQGKVLMDLYTVLNTNFEGRMQIHKVQNFDGYTSTSGNASVTIPELVGAKMVWISAGYNIQIFFIGKSSSAFSMFGSRDWGTGFSLTFDPDTGTITSRLAWNTWDAAAGYCRIGKNIYYLK
ncbi:MAG: hypothetical protein ACLTXE_17925 [Enterocloster aldenensis]